MLRLAMPALIQRQHAEAVGQTPRHGVPAAGVLEVSVEQYHGWCRRISPVTIVQAQPIEDDGFIPHLWLGIHDPSFDATILGLLLVSSRASSQADDTATQ